MSEAAEKHNWNPGPLGNAYCLRCGCSFFDINQEITRRSRQPCPGRYTPNPVIAPNQPLPPSPIRG